MEQFALIVYTQTLSKILAPTSATVTVKDTFMKIVKMNSLAQRLNVRLNGNLVIGSVMIALSAKLNAFAVIRKA